jgi:RNA polymerase sigma-70 factor (ECF subfamily)
LDWLRRKGRRGREEIVTEDMATTRELSPPAEASRTELVARVRQAVGELPDDQREALALRESEDLTFAQIARLLDVPAGTVKSRVRYALLKLAEKLEPYRRELEE